MHFTAEPDRRQIAAARRRAPRCSPSADGSGGSPVIRLPRARHDLRTFQMQTDPLNL